MRQQLYITNHAIARFRERIEPEATEVAAVCEMLRLLAGAKAKHFKRFNRRTTFIPTERCLMICSWNKVVTVIDRAGPVSSAMCGDAT